MFLNPIVSPIDESIYRPTNHYKIYDVNLFWQIVQYNNNLLKLQQILIYIFCNIYFKNKKLISF